MMAVIGTASALQLLFCYHSVVRRIDWRALLCVLTICACIAAQAPCAAAGNNTAAFDCPVFLNGEPVYSRTGSAGLLSVAADAVREAFGADAAVLPASCAGGSLSEGPVEAGDLAAVFSADEVLVHVQVSGSELCALLNEMMTFGSPLFPHISGVYVRAERILDENGHYAGRVEYVQQGGEIVAARSAESSSTAYSALGVELDVITTADIARKATWLEARAVPQDGTIAQYLTDYMRRTPDAAITYYADSQRLVVVSDTIDAQLAISKLSLPVPSPVVVNLSQPAMVADTIMYALSGQDRNLVCRIVGTKIPYALAVSGLLARDPVSLDTTVSVTQTLPPGRKTANTFDENTVFADLSRNNTVPDGSVLSVDLTGIYSSETVLHIYYYDANGDIVPLDAHPIVDANGWVSFPVDASVTYILNARELDSTAFEPPTTARPYTLGIIIIFGAFLIWFFLFIAVRQKRKRAEPPPEEPELPL